MAKIDATAVARDTAALVQVPSVTGDERAALERAGDLAVALGLEARLREHDLTELRADPSHPGEEAPRTELADLVVTRPGTAGGPRIALCAHVDVVGAGNGDWPFASPWSGAIADGFVHGRGAADMKGGLVAALHALAACEQVDATLIVVSSEEDGGQGSFAALRCDSAFDACVIPEPTGFAVVCAQAGALTFTGHIPGVAAHAAERLNGTSAIDSYLPVHAALAEHERRLNDGVEHELMAALELPYPLVVGRLEAGEWSSTVPDHLVFEGRAPVRLEETCEQARAGVEAVVAAACPPARLHWTGGQFAPAQTPAGHPLVGALREAAATVLGSPPPLAGVPWGADMRLWCAAGVPTVMFGTRGIELAHAAAERVAVADLGALARSLAGALPAIAARVV